MKLAEALTLRADAQARLQQLRQRLAFSARHQEGEEPPEDPRSLLDEVERTSAELLDLIRRINRTNASSEFESGRTISDALAMRDVLSLRRTIYAELAQIASTRQDRVTRSELRYVSAVNVQDIRREADDLAKQYRELDAKIQGLNW